MYSGICGEQLTSVSHEAAKDKSFVNYSHVPTYARIHLTCMAVFRVHYIVLVISNNIRVYLLYEL